MSVRPIFKRKIRQDVNTFYSLHIELGYQLLSESWLLATRDDASGGPRCYCNVDAKLHMCVYIRL